VEYLISKTEIIRRKWAYLNLSSSLIIGAILSSIIFHGEIFALYYAIIAIVMFLIGAFSFIFFRNLTKTKIVLTSHSLQRVTGNQIENFPLARVNKVVIKWTTNKTIREVYIWLNNGRSIFISALNHFEQFKDNFLEKINKEVIVQERHEPLDFDHPLFYSILGLCLGGVTNVMFKLLINITFQELRLGSLFLSLYLIALGLYFFIAKPISKRLGKTTASSDIIVGILMILLGFMFFFFVLIR
jgi:hypothetical protein